MKTLNSHAEHRRLTVPARDGAWSRATWFILALFLLLLGCVVFGARLVLDASLETRLSTLESHMTMQAQNRVARLTVWFGGLQKTLKDVADADIVRLFSVESAARKGSGLETQTHFLSSQLTDFRTKNAFLGAALYLDERSSTIMTGDLPPPSAALSQDLTHVLQNGTARVRPVRLDTRQNPVLDVLTPVFAPLYMDATGKHCVGVLLVSVDISGEVTMTSGADGEFSRIVYRADHALHSVPGQGLPAVRLGPAWMPEETSASQGLPLAARALPLPKGGAEWVYACALAVPDLPWLVVQTLPVDLFEERYEDFRRTVLLVSGLLCAVVSLGLFMIWWWLFERRERQAAEELRRLYKTVNRQKQLLEGINASIEEGIVLCHAGGRIVYVNDAFARMTGETAAALQNREYSSLLMADLAQSLRDNLPKTLQSPEPLHVMQTLRVQGGLRHYEVICTPFHATLNTPVSEIGLVVVYRDITELVALQERSTRMLTNTVNAFVRGVEAADEYLYGHSTHMSTLAQALAQRMGQGNEATLVTAAQLSQVGMIRLPRRLMSKAAAFTQEERAQMEKHVEYALSALEGIDFGIPVQQAISHMYERLDGSGYPHKLCGDAISVEGRILAVASTFCAMLRPRSYRTSLTMEEAWKLLHKDAPKYDARVFEALHAFLDTEEGQAFLGTLTQRHG